MPVDASDFAPVMFDQFTQAADPRTRCVGSVSEKVSDLEADA